MVKIMEIPIKIHDLGVPLFLETPMTSRIHAKDVSYCSGFLAKKRRPLGDKFPAEKWVEEHKKKHTKSMDALKTQESYHSMLLEMCI